MSTVKVADIRRINRNIILEKIIQHGMISRAYLSTITGLTKATISVQVGVLLEEGLIRETQVEHRNVGRRPIMLSINNEAGYVLGIDLDYEQIHYSLTDLQGNAKYSHTDTPNTHEYDEIVRLLIKQIKNYQSICTDSRYGLVSVIVGIHGTVNNDESIHFIPKYKWHDKNLSVDLKKKLDLDIHVENNANLSSYAEKVFQYHTSNNLVNVILTFGIGAGIMIDGDIHRGYHGYAGEMGHMIVSLDGKSCSCGNKGCWELYASEPSLIKQLSAELNRPNLTRDDVITIQAKEDITTIEQTEILLKHISIGLNNIINLYNPETIVINSKILTTFPNALKIIESHLHSSVSQYCEIVLSDLGDKACVKGACALAIQRFLEVQRLDLTLSEQSYKLFKQSI